MARRKKKEEDDGYTPQVGSDAIRAVIGVFLLAIALFLILAGFELAGIAGTFVFTWLSILLGVGYALLPVAFILAAIVFFNSFDGQRLHVVRLVCTALFALATLGLIEIALPGKGGLIGSLMTTPLVQAFDKIASVIFLLAFVVASIIVAFEAHPLSLLKRIRDRMERDDEEEFLEPLDVPVTETIAAPPDDENTLDEDAHTDDVPDEETQQPKKSRGF